jgi:hypothetical protein
MAEKPTIVEALAAVMEDVRAVGKGERNTQQNYNFRGIDAVVNAAGPALRKHGVVVVPLVEDINYRDVQTSTGKASRECTVKVRYRFHGPAGDHIDCVTPGESMDFGDKGAPKAMSVAFRIALLQALCLPTTDTDPDAQQYERGHQASQYSAPVGRGSNPAQQRSNGQQQRPAQRPAADSQPEPEQVAVPKNATEARAQLAATCTDNRWDLGVVADRFKAETGTELGQATDRDAIVRFRASLFSLSDAALRAPAEAGAR